MASKAASPVASPHTSAAGRAVQGERGAAEHGGRHVIRVPLDFGAQRQERLGLELYSQHGGSRGGTGDDRRGRGAETPPDGNVGVRGQGEVGYFASPHVTGGGEAPID